jgi:hypothetical protein
VRTIETSTDIAAPRWRVWQVLTDVDRYPAWNPFITSVDGALREGGKLRVRIEPPGRKAITFGPTVVALAQERELRWRGRLLIPGLFDGEHAFRLEERTGGCRFRQTERFSGVLVPLFGEGLLEATRQGFEAMNAALKARAEDQK